MARTHKTVQIKAKMAEQEHAPRKLAGRPRSPACCTATAEGDTQESAEEAQMKPASDDDEADDEEEKAADEEEEDEDAEQ
ncbi:hypothetical protein GQ600_18931 [Phytophthora cactorum]|nr:hypothetical protein GQ600_18931 [Phytophthora cactorum]